MHSVAFGLVLATSFLALFPEVSDTIRPMYKTRSMPCCTETIGTHACQLLRNNRPYEFRERCRNDADFGMLQCCRTCDTNIAVSEDRTERQLRNSRPRAKVSQPTPPQVSTDMSQLKISLEVTTIVSQRNSCGQSKPGPNRVQRANAKYYQEATGLSTCFVDYTFFAWQTIRGLLILGTKVNFSTPRNVSPSPLVRHRVYSFF